MAKTIEMTETREGSPNGRDVNRYEEGQVYTLPDQLADIFLTEEWAVEAESDDARDAQEIAEWLVDGTLDEIDDRLEKLDPEDETHVNGVEAALAIEQDQPEDDIRVGAVDRFEGWL